VVIVHVSQFAPVALHEVGTADVTLSVPVVVIGPPVRPVPVPTEVTVPEPLGVAAVQHGFGLLAVVYSIACPLVGVNPVQNGTLSRPATVGFG